MSLSLSRKVEKACTLYLKSVIPSGLNIYEGHEKAEIVDPPYLVCFAEDMQPHPEMPTSSGVRVVAMRFELRIDSEDDDSRPSLDDWRVDVEDAMSDIAALAAFIAITNIDDSGFKPHVYDTMPESEPTEFERTDWVEQFRIMVVCQQVPAPPPPPPAP
jgi:hypothetical protein